MQRIAASLVEQKVMVVRKFRKGDWDRTNWYSIEYEVVAKLAATVPDKIIQIEKKRDEVALARHRRFTGELS